MKKVFDNPTRLEQKIRYQFCESSLLLRALTHPSSTCGQDNQTLEFLGDAVLELVVSDYIFAEYTELAEGAMSVMRSNLVCESTLAKAGNRIEIGRYLELGKGEEVSGGREKPSIIADTVEALIGAAYLDGGYENAKRVIFTVLREELENPGNVNSRRDFKSVLQEWSHKHALGDVAYETVKTEGPPHDMRFYVNVLINQNKVADGVGKSKKGAEQKAAAAALKILKRRYEDAGI